MRAANDQAVPVGETEQVAPPSVKIYESEFYQPFADWLKNDLDEVTEVLHSEEQALNQSGEHPTSVFTSPWRAT